MVDLSEKDSLCRVKGTWNISLVLLQQELLCIKTSQKLEITSGEKMCYRFHIDYKVSDGKLNWFDIAIY